MELESLHDAGHQVVAVVRQRGRSKASGVRVEMLLAQVWSFEGGLTTRMVTYADPAEALKAVGLV
jgi:ketosteroid isomerase-like protein